jgi:hypothetical protein
MLSRLANPIGRDAKACRANGGAECQLMRFLGDRVQAERLLQVGDGSSLAAQKGSEQGHCRRR